VSHRLFVVVSEQVGSELLQLKPRVIAEERPHGVHPQLGMTQQGVDLQSIAGAEDRGLEHIVAGAQALQRLLHGLLSNAEPFPDLHRGRAVTEADDGDVHGGGTGL